MSHTFVKSDDHIWAWNDEPFVMRASDEVKNWLLAHVGKEMTYSSKWGWKGSWRILRIDGCAHFGFADPKKAMLFKLAWIGV